MSAAPIRKKLLVVLQSMQAMAQKQGSIAANAMFGSQINALRNALHSRKKGRQPRRKTGIAAARRAAKKRNSIRKRG